MEKILENIRLLAPFAIACWTLFVIITLRKPQRYLNSVVLMLACFFTLLLFTGLFGEYMTTALVTLFVLILLILFMVPVLLVLNGIQLLRRESKSLPHMLSIILGIGVGIGEVASIVYLLGFYSSGTRYSLHLWAYFLFASVFYFSCLVLNFVVYSVFIQWMPHVYQFDYVIIHGCGLKDGWEVTKLLSGRIDKAIEVYNKCKTKPILIASGGKGSDEELSEAEAIGKYLQERGIPKEQILLEDQSRTTLENIQFSNAIIQKRGIPGRIALVSSNYHIYRCLIYAKKNHMKCVGIGAKVAFYYWPTAVIREFVAVFVQPKILIWSIIGYLIFMLPFFYTVTHL